MDIATLVGLLGGFGIIIGAIATGGDIMLFINVPSILIVVGGTFMVTEIALAGGMPPFWLAASRIGFAALLMSTIWVFMGRPLFKEKTATADKCNLLVIGGLSSAVPFSLLAWGQQYVTSGFAGVSMAAVALIVLPLAHFTVPGEQMTPRKTVGFLIGFVGVVILIGAQAFQTTGASFETAGRIGKQGVTASIDGI